MAQVTISDPQESSWINTQSVTFNTPAGAQGDLQIAIMAYYSVNVSPPAISGWTVADQEQISGTTNRMVVYTRTLTGTTSTDSQSVTFGGLSTGFIYSFNLNGSLTGSVVLNTAPTFEVSKVIPSISSVEVESLQIVAMMSGTWQRQVTQSDFTERFDDFRYAGSGGVFLAVGDRITDFIGNTQSSIWNLTNESNTSVPEQEQVVYLNTIILPKVSSSEGIFSATLTLPSIVVDIVESSQDNIVNQPLALTYTTKGTIQGVTWAVDSGPGVIGAKTGIFSSSEVGTTVISLTSDENNANVDYITITNIPATPIVTLVDTASSPVIIKGTGLPGSTLQLYIDTVLENSVTVDSFGAWEILVTKAPGVYQITTKQTKDSYESALSANTVLVIGTEDPDTTTTLERSQPYARSWFRIPEVLSKINTGQG